MKRKTFNQMRREVEAAKPLKKVTDDTPLPYVFDLFWDAKRGADLQNLKDNRQVRQFLAENGFDVEDWLHE